MPVYEYHCDGCDSYFDAEQRITADPLDTCPQCGGQQVRRLISQSTFVLKGTGWYTTDYARKSDAAVAKKADESPACCNCAGAGSCDSTTA